MPQWTMFSKDAAGKKSKDKEPIQVDYPNHEVIDAMSPEAKQKLVKMISQSIARNRYKNLTEPYETTQRYLDAARNSAARWGLQVTEEQLKKEAEAALNEDEDRRLAETPEGKKKDFKRQVPEWNIPTSIVVSDIDILEYLEEEEKKNEAENTAGDNQEGGGAADSINPESEPEPRKGRRKGGR